MKSLYVVKSGETLGDDGSSVIAGAWDIDTLNAGALAIFDSEGNLIDPASIAFSGSKIYFGLGTADGPALSSVLIPRTATYKYQAYVAPVAAVKYLGSDTAAGAGNGSLNLPSSLTVGDVVGVDIIDLEKPEWETTRIHRYEFVVNENHVLTGDVAGNVIYDLVTMINADADRLVNAVQMEDGSNNNDGIRFTAITAGHDFGIGIVPGVLGNADVVTDYAINGEYNGSVTNPVPNQKGVGTSAQILQLEKDVASWLGDHKSEKYSGDLYNRASQVVNGATYSLFTIKTVQTLDPTSLEPAPNPTVTIYIAVASGDSTLITNITNILNAWTQSFDVYAKAVHTH